jgi:hypothetical protein
MAGIVEKVLSYRRAQWHKSAKEGDNLEQIVRSVYKKLNRSNKRTIDRDTKSIRCGKPEELDSGGIRLHYTADTPGEFASVVRTATDEDEDIATDSMAPLDNSEFLDAEAFVLIVKDDVFICVSRLRETVVRFIIAKSIEKAGFSDDAVGFELRAAANVDKVDMIHQDGVDEIDLRIGIYAASHLHAERKLSASGLQRGIARAFQALGGFEDEEQNDNLIVGVTLKGDARLKTGIVVGQKRLDTIAENIINTAEDDDNFKIRTRSGARISQDEIYIRGTASVEKEGSHWSGQAPGLN